MKNLQKGFIGLPILIAIILGIVVLGGGTYYVVYQQSASQTTVDNNVPTLPTTNNNQTQQTQVSNTQPTPSATTPPKNTTTNATSNIKLYSVSPGLTEDGPSYLYMEALGLGFSSAKNFITFTPQDPSILPAYNLRSIALPSYAQGTAINLTLNSSQFSYGTCRIAGGMCQGNITGFPAGNYYVSITNGDCTGTNCESNKVLVNIKSTSNGQNQSGAGTQ